MKVVKWAVILNELSVRLIQSETLQRSEESLEGGVTTLSTVSRETRSSRDASYVMTAAPIYVIGK